LFEEVSPSEVSSVHVGLCGALDFGARGLVKAVVEIIELENIADVFLVYDGKINVHVVIKMD
jgi:hypothetical protein